MTNIFLLGGYDLEMLEIKRLLENHSALFFDHHLNWSNANLSSYSHLFTSQPAAHYYGIELHEDCPPPIHYTRIDHHNDLHNLPAAILQVTSLLNISPNRHIHLVAANDSGYIPAMQALGATKQEIHRIRHLDRAAQGVTQLDEQLADYSITHNKTTIGQQLTIVQSLTPHISAICDRLYPYLRLLIYNDTEWVYYGEGKEALTIELDSLIQSGRIYHGGGPKGYIGAAKGMFSKQEIFQFITSIQHRYEQV